MNTSLRQSQFARMVRSCANTGSPLFQGVSDQMASLRRQMPSKACDNWKKAAYLKRMYGSLRLCFGFSYRCAIHSSAITSRVGLGQYQILSQSSLAMGKLCTVFISHLRGVIVRRHQEKLKIRLLPHLKFFRKCRLHNKLEYPPENKKKG